MEVILEASGTNSEAIVRLGSRVGLTFCLALFGAFFLVLTAKLSLKVSSTDIALYMTIYTIFTIMVFAALIVGRAKTMETAPAGLLMGLVVWSYLLLDEEIFFFDRMNQAAANARGDFSAAAYGEVGLWMFATLVLFLLTAPHIRQFAKTMFASPYKWMTLFALLCVFSATYSDGVLYSLAWSVKLSLVVWAVLLCAMFIRNRSELLTILRAALVSLGLVVLTEGLLPVIDPSDAWWRDRLGGIIHPTDVSCVGGLLLLIVLIMYTLEKRRWLLGIGVLALYILLQGAGKTSIIAAVVGAAIFLLYQKRVALLMGFFATLCPLALIVLLASPTGAYLDRYAQRDDFETLSGRFQLWKAALPEIARHPILGHGYVASRFFPLVVEGNNSFENIGNYHMHNAFIEVLYNNGIAGLLLILAMIFITVKSARRMIRRKSSREVFLLAAGLLSLEVYLLLNGLTEPTFAGHPYTFFVFFLILFVLTERLRVLDLADLSLAALEMPRDRTIQP